MKVTVSVAGKWRAFKLAAQLERRGHLHRIIASHPRFLLRDQGVSLDRIVSLPMAEILGRGLARLPWLKHHIPADHLKNSLFDRHASHHVGDCDVFVGWAGCSLRALRTAKAAGAVTCIERESAHIAFSNRCLTEEFASHGYRYRGTDPRRVEVHLRENAETDYIIVPSMFAYGTFIDEGVDPAKVKVIPSGVDAQRFRPVEKEDDKFRIIFVGGLTLRKGVHYLLEAVSGLPADEYEVVLVGSLSEEIKPFLERYSGHYIYAGVIPNAELYRVYSSGSVFVLPSVEEGWAYVIGEAMACGLPVIATTNTGAVDIVREGVDGFVVPIRDPGAIQEKLVCLREDEVLRRQMGRAARDRALMFTWDRYGESSVTAYREMLNRSEAMS